MTDPTNRAPGADNLSEFIRDFDIWLKELDVEMHKRGFEGSYTDQTGSDSWIEMFKDGMTPQEAAAEEHYEWRRA